MKSPSYRLCTLYSNNMTLLIQGNFERGTYIVKVIVWKKEDVIPNDTTVLDKVDISNRDIGYNTAVSNEQNINCIVSYNRKAVIRRRRKKLSKSINEKYSLLINVKIVIQNKYSIKEPCIIRRDNTCLPGLNHLYHWAAM